MRRIATRNRSVDASSFARSSCAGAGALLSDIFCLSCLLSFQGLSIRAFNGLLDCGLWAGASARDGGVCEWCPVPPRRFSVNTCKFGKAATEAACSCCNCSSCMATLPTAPIIDCEDTAAIWRGFCAWLALVFRRRTCEACVRRQRRRRHWSGFALCRSLQPIFPLMTSGSSSKVAGRVSSKRSGSGRHFFKRDCTPFQDDFTSCSKTCIAQLGSGLELLD